LRRWEDDDEKDNIVDPGTPGTHYLSIAFLFLFEKLSNYIKSRRRI